MVITMILHVVVGELSLNIEISNIIIDDCLSHTHASVPVFL